MIATGPYWWYVNIGSVNGLVPSGNKQLSKPMSTRTEFNIAICCHQDTFCGIVTTYNDIDLVQIGRQIGPSLGTTCLHPRITLCHIFQICAHSPSTHHVISVINCPIASGFNCFYNWLILLWLLFSGADKARHTFSYTICLMNTLIPWFEFHLSQVINDPAWLR